MMKQEFENGRAVLAALFAVSVASAAIPQGLQAQVLTACYVPDVGVVYRIQAAGLPDECTETTHVEFSWNMVGPAGPQGEPGPQGPSGGGMMLETTTVIRTNVSIPQDATVGISDLSCPSGWFATGSGFDFDLTTGGNVEPLWLKNQPVGDAGWLFTIFNDFGGTPPLVVDLYIRCVRLVTTSP